MIKMMTAELTFDAINSGKIDMKTKLVVPKKADYKNRALNDASKICLSEGQTITVEDALTGLIVVSGGDAAITLAEKLGGSEQKFVEMMTKRAREIGMEYTSFGNSSGLPDPDNLSTSKELAILTEHIIRTYPEYMPFFKIRRYEFVNPLSDFCRTWVKGHAINYNKLLFVMGGAEGMKTGHTNGGGYGIVGVTNRKGRRLIAVINGLPAKNHDALAQEAKRLLEYGYDTTFNKEINVNVSVPVWYGNQGSVNTIPQKPFVMTFNKGTNLDALRIVAVVPEKVSAPVKQGQEIGKVVATLNGIEIKSEKLFAGQDVPRTKLFGRVFRNIKYFLTGE
jgi:D-alanyl-D-alanine carboxypeptidase (penicillin-binding protein 5/6)